MREWAGAGSPFMNHDEWGLSNDHESFFGGNCVDLNRAPIRRPSFPFVALEFGKNRSSLHVGPRGVPRSALVAVVLMVASRSRGGTNFGCLNLYRREPEFPLAPKLQLSLGNAARCLQPTRARIRVASCHLTQMTRRENTKMRSNEAKASALSLIFMHLRLNRKIVSEINIRNSYRTY